ncbi:hypothetical protein J6590_040925 [Homalodisca vitripennis]|nr:hypothetical protein J6590_040925 [Homalodisca vitripennis]
MLDIDVTAAFGFACLRQRSRNVFSALFDNFSTYTRVLGLHTAFQQMQEISRRSQSILQPHFRTLGALTCHRGMHNKLAHISCGRRSLSDCHEEHQRDVAQDIGTIQKAVYQFEEHS